MLRIKNKQKKYYYLFCKALQINILGAIFGNSKQNKQVFPNTFHVKSQKTQNAIFSFPEKSVRKVLVFFLFFCLDPVQRSVNQPFISKQSLF